MEKRITTQDAYIVSGLKNDSKEAFSLLFHAYYKDLVLFCGSFIVDQATCEDIVQSIFIKLWKDRHSLNIETSIKSFLLKSVKNKCYDEYRHQCIRKKYEILYNEEVNNDTENYILHSDLSMHLEIALKKLPKTHQEAFILNRFQGIKYKEIAKRYNVSERMIEVRISKALELLRKYLKDFLTITLSIILC